MKRLFQYVHRSIRRQMMMNMLLLCILSLGMMSAVYFLFSYQFELTSLGNSLQAEVELVFEEKENQLNAVLNTCESIESSQLFQNFLQQEYSIQSDLLQKEYTKESMYVDELQADAELAVRVKSMSWICGIYLIAENGFLSKSNGATFQKTDFRETEWYQNALQSTIPIWYTSHAGSRVVYSTDDTLLMCCYPFKNKKTLKNVGVLVVEIDQEAYTESLRKLQLENSSFFLLNKDNTPFYHSNENADAMELEQEITGIARQHIPQLNSGKTTVGIQTAKYQVLIKKSSVKGVEWSLAGIVSNHSLMANAYRLLGILGGMFVILSVMAIVISRWTAYRFTEPVLRLEEAVKAVRDGDLSISVPVRGSNEITRLEAGFNEMTRQINQLVNSVYEDQRHIRRLELKALQEQINPHFLYNSLDMITWLLRLRQNDQAIEMMGDLSKIFRISLSHGHEIITVRNEIQHARSYLKLQNIQHNTLFTYEIIEPEPEVLEYQTLKLIVQPVIENCIQHGVRSNGESMHITVSVMDTGKNIEYCVEDTGTGMSPEELQRLRDKLEEPYQEEVTASKEMNYSISGGYGLKNVQDRIRLNYGEEYGLHVYAEEGNGTCVVISIPKHIFEEEQT